MNISVILPSYNSQLSLPSTLKALEAQKTEASYEVIVVDCSESSSVKELCASYPSVQFHHVEKRFNPGIGRNIGAELAHGELLVFLDSDVVLSPDSLDQAWRFHQAGHEIFGGALELNEETSVGMSSYLEHYFFNHESQKLRPACIRSNLSSALMVVARSLFLKDGGFKDIPRMQDTELTERLRSAGHELMFNPQILGFQTQDSPLAKVLRKIQINGKNLYFIRYQKKHPLMKAALAATLPLLSGLKVSRIILRHLRYQNGRGKCMTILLTPLLGISGAYWMYGIYHSMFFSSEIGTARD